MDRLVSIIRLFKSGHEEFLKFKGIVIDGNYDIQKIQSIFAEEEIHVIEIELMELFLIPKDSLTSVMDNLFSSNTNCVFLLLDTFLLERKHEDKDILNDILVMLEYHIMAIQNGLLISCFDNVMKAPPLFRKQSYFHMINFPKPSKEERKEHIIKFFKQRNIASHIAELISISTNGFSFKQLDDVCGKIFLHFKTSIDTKAPHENDKLNLFNIRSSNRDECNQLCDFSINPSSMENEILRKSVQFILSSENIYNSEVASTHLFHGYESLKSDISHLLFSPIEYSHAYKSMGIASTNGILLFGPPGCGKSLLARNLAHQRPEFNVIYIQGPSIFSSFIGETERHIRSLFESARQNAPSIILIDDIHTILQKRNEGKEEGTALVRINLLNTFLNEMDGISSDKENETKKVIVLATTYNPNLIDEALLRPGRLDHLKFVDRPSKADRDSIVRGYLCSIIQNIKSFNIFHNPKYNQLLQITDSWTGADLFVLLRDIMWSIIERDSGVKYSESNIETLLDQFIEKSLEMNEHVLLRIHMETKILGPIYAKYINTSNA